jgi:hypothetical protein
MRKNLIYFSIALFFCIMIINCMGSDSSSTSNTYDSDYSKETYSQTDNEWYSGGTLHKSFISEWKTASDKNKLATCADFVALVNKNMKISDLKYEAEQLRDCIDEATRGLESTNSMKVSDIASKCITIMN